MKKKKKKLSKLERQAICEMCHNALPANLGARWLCDIGVVCDECAHRLIAIRARERGY